MNEHFRNNYFTAVRICLLLLMTHAPARASSYSYGSSGQTVRTIQERLSAWGYYTGKVDSIFGTLTRKAVTAFQKKNGLTPDGVAGPATDYGDAKLCYGPQ
ncbi:MAG: peptidoglycan-binding protein, partial [Oscillospiraceae bacterium]|nr:peptidoglycan-binding protein [Oscillospiraceae bacterium]